MNYIQSIPTHMDFEGQARAEKLSRVIITTFGIIGVVFGYAVQQFSLTVYILGAGFALTALLTMPPWPMYRRKPLKWQPARDDNGKEQAASQQQQNAPKKGKKK